MDAGSKGRPSVSESAIVVKAAMTCSSSRVLVMVDGLVRDVAVRSQRRRMTGVGTALWKFLAHPISFNRFVSTLPKRQEQTDPTKQTFHRNCTVLSTASRARHCLLRHGSGVCNYLCIYVALSLIGSALRSHRAWYQTRRGSENLAVLMKLNLLHREII